MTAVLTAYQQLLATGELQADPAQALAATALDRLAVKLAYADRPGFWSRLTGRAPQVPGGVYMWGGVGRGKTMLLGVAFEAIDVPRKRRVHFHEFMLEVHDRLRIERRSEEGDPITTVAEDLAEEAPLLAFDEMIVNNSADAMILSRLFTNLLRRGVTVITTSNRAPRELYEDGLNRELFLPFIDLIERRLEVVAVDGPVDYRRQRIGDFPTWYVPNGQATTEALSAAFFRMTDFPPEDRANVPTAEIPLPGGRKLHVPKSLKGVAVFSFKRLCGEPRGAADYLAIARRYHTVFVVGIPKMGPERRNEAARFSTFVDSLYEHGVKLIAGADAPPAELYTAGDGLFEFERTVSRLNEMQSEDYLARGHGTQ